MRKLSLITLLLAVIIFLSFTYTQAQTSPYPASTVFTGASFNFTAVQSAAPGSDIWPITWADDGNLYTAWGDGGGFGGTGDDGRVALGYGRVEGPADNWTGHNIWGGKDPDTPATFVGKSNNIISVDGALYTVVTEEDAWHRGKIGKSLNHGLSWTFNGGSFSNSTWDFDESSGAFAAPTFIQFGQDYQGARDNYVYLYSEQVVDASNDLLLARVPKTQIATRSAYEFVSGFNAGQPVWSSAIGNAVSVWHHPIHAGWGMQAMYHPATGRYLLLIHHVDNGGWGIYDAPEPWGPWSTVFYADSWGPGDRQFTYSLNQKWMSPDGHNLFMVYDAADQFNVIPMVLAFEDAPPPEVTPTVANLLPGERIEVNCSNPLNLITSTLNSVLYECEPNPTPTPTLTPTPTPTFTPTPTPTATPIPFGLNQGESISPSCLTGVMTRTDIISETITVRCD